MNKGNVVGCENSGEKMWLLKIPKYLSRRFETLEAGSEIGRFIIKYAFIFVIYSTFHFFQSNFADKPPEFLLNLNENVITDACGTFDQNKVPIPLENKIVIVQKPDQTLVCFSQGFTLKKKLKLTITIII